MEVHDGVPTAHSPMSLGAVCPMLSGTLGLPYVAIHAPIQSRNSREPAVQSKVELNRYAVGGVGYRAGRGSRV